MNIPEGYVLVPVELTQEMIQAGIDTECVDTGDEYFDETQDYRAVYKSFLESAPKAPAYDEAKERELFEEWADEKWFCLDCKFFESGNNFEDQATKWLYEAWLACAKSRARSAE